METVGFITKMEEHKKNFDNEGKPFYLLLSNEEVELKVFIGFESENLIQVGLVISQKWRYSKTFLLTN